MTAQTRTVNKSRFEQGDTPQGSDYVDLIDSYLSLADTTAQSLSSPLTMSGALGVSATASASALEILGVVRVSGKATFNTGVEVSGRVSADSLTVAGAASVASLWVGGEEIKPTSEAVAVGEMHVTATASFVASAAGAYSIVPGSFSALSMLQNATSASPTLCEIEYTGTATARFFANAFISIKASANNKLSGMRIGVNASALSRTQIRRLISSTTDIGAAAVGGTVVLAPNDRASLMMTNITDTVGLDIVDLVFSLRSYT